MVLEISPAEKFLWEIFVINQNKRLKLWWYWVDDIVAHWNYSKVPKFFMVNVKNHWVAIEYERYEIFNGQVKQRNNNHCE